MTTRVRFGAPRLAVTCATAEAIDREWGVAGSAVRRALSVLAVCACCADFEALPNVERQGDQLVFKSDPHDVLIDLTDGRDATVVVSAVEVASNGGAR
jgi:hypothetical protein